MQALKEENEALRARIVKLEKEAESRSPTVYSSEMSPDPFKRVDGLTNQEIFRFGRQLVTPNFGYEAQLKLRNKSFLIVGAGGLGAPAALYLGAGGVGRLGIVDHDVVGLNNLHRQVIHTEGRIDMNKAASAAASIAAIYPGVEVIPYAYSLDSTNALELIRQYDIIIDATDNIATRYLLSDASVLAGKPVVSGSALRTDGQLTVYNYNDGPCFRCLHPTPPPASSVGRCIDSGVLGVVPGVIGILQALEAIKIAIGSKALNDPSFLIFSAMSNPMFRTIKLRQKKKDCAVCGENPTITELIDYVQFCHGELNDNVVSECILQSDERISPCEYQQLIKDSVPHVLIDVRPKVQYDICSLPNSIHIPLDNLRKEINRIKEIVKAKRDANSQDKRVETVVVCRLGNDSQNAVRMLQEEGIDHPKDIIGGLHRWSIEVDDMFPVY